MKIGDEVYLREDSELNDGFEYNPIGIKGRITGVDANETLPISVDWGFGCTSYKSSDLILASEYGVPAMNQGHPSASILMEIAKEAAINPEYWKEFEWEGKSGSWNECGGDKPIYFLLLENYNIRRKPRTIRIGNYDVPEPIEIVTSDSDLCVRFDTHLEACTMQKALQELLGAKQ